MAGRGPNLLAFGEIANSLAVKASRHAWLADAVIVVRIVGPFDSVFAETSWPPWGRRIERLVYTEDDILGSRHSWPRYTYAELDELVTDGMLLRALARAKQHDWGASWNVSTMKSMTQRARR